jgi:predicted small lipoprotein YifL
MTPPPAAQTAGEGDPVGRRLGDLGGYHRPQPQAAVRLRPVLRVHLAAAASLFLWLAGCGSKDPQEAVAAALPDPASARFQNVRDRDDHVCGEVNGRDARGGLSGYRRFVYDKGSEAALVDPGLRDEPPPASTANPACAKPFAYQAVDERLACAAAPAQQAGSERQREFEDLWRRACA